MAAISRDERRRPCGPVRCSESSLILHLVDTNAAIVDALWFRNYADVTIACDDLLSTASGTVVSPANSSGFMDGDIDAEYIALFGVEIQTRVRRRPKRVLVKVIGE